MRECYINIANFAFENRSQYIFYICSEFVIYKDLDKIVLSDCSGKNICSCKCPTDYKHYSFIEIDKNNILFCFAGKVLVLFDRNDNKTYYNELQVDKIGRCVTKIFKLNQKNQILFGTKNLNFVQFVTYDYILNKRISQTSSWRMSEITDMCVYDDLFVGLLDKTYMVFCNSDTCQLNSTRFETGVINSKIIKYHDSILYTCGGVLKIFKNEAINTIKIPFTKINKLEEIQNDTLYLICNDGKNIAAFDLIEQKIKWEIKGISEIKYSSYFKGKHFKEIHDLVILCTNDYVNIIDLTVGQSIYHSKSSLIFDIQKTGDHILLHKYQGISEFLSGTQNV